MQSQKTKLINRYTALILSAVTIMMCFSFTGCTGTKDVMKAPENAYSSTFIPIDEKFEPMQMFFAKDRVIMLGYDSEEGVQTICSMNEDGSETKFINMVEDISEYGGWVEAFTITPNENIYYCVNSGYYNQDDEQYINVIEFVKISLDGELLFRKKLEDILSESAQDIDINNIYIGSIVCDDSENLYFSAGNIVMGIDSNGKLIAAEEVESDYISKLVVSSDGTLYIFYSMRETYENMYCKLNKTTGKIEAAAKVPGPISRYTHALIAGSSTHDFYYNDGSNISAYDINTGISTPVLNWISSDINSNNVNGIAVVDDKTFLCTIMDNMSDGYYSDRYSLVKLEYIPPEENVPKYILKLAAFYLNYRTRDAVIKFNRSSEKYRIDVVDYSQYNTYDDYTQGIIMLNNDITTGNIPDIIEISNDVQVENYIAKGVFTDLYELLDQDAELKREDYLQNVLEAFEVNGKLYEIPTHFSISTMAGKTSKVGKGPGWNMDELLAAMDKMPQGAAVANYLDRDTFVNMCCTMARDEFIDRDTGVCSFDTPDFIKMLEFAKTITNPDENINWDEVDDDYWIERDFDYREDRALLYWTSLADYREYWRTMKATFGEDITFIGFPTSSKNGSAIDPMISYAISSKTRHKEGAWEFLRYFISDEYQESMTYQFPIKISALEKYGKEALKPTGYTDEEGNFVQTDWDTVYYLGNTEINIGKITPEAVEEINKFIKSVNRVYRNDQDMLEIINEETMAFFAGDKTAEETAKIIQNRVQIYVSENR